ncbi:MAG: hypothetical protein PHE24_04080 [Patescibacteria group bacterium]|nr:hypothetical protein [Patescibacteria group bacterium]
MQKPHVYKKLPIRKLWRLAHALAVKNNIDLSRGEPAYLSLLKFVPPEDLHLWPRDLRVYNANRERYNSSFFIAPVQHFNKYRRLEGAPLRNELIKMRHALAKSERERQDQNEKQAKLIDFLKERVAALTKSSPARNKESNPVESGKESGMLREKLAARDAELAVTREAAANFQNEIESLREKVAEQELELITFRKAYGKVQPAEPPAEAARKKRSYSRGSIWEADEAYFGGKVKGVCSDILDTKDVDSPALREKMMEERREIYVKVGDRWFYSHAIYLRLVTCNPVKSNKQYDELLSRIKNVDIRKMYPSSADYNNVHRFPSRSCETLSQAA